MQVDQINAALVSIWGYFKKLVPTPNIWTVVQLSIFFKYPFLCLYFRQLGILNNISWERMLLCLLQNWGVGLIVDLCNVCKCAVL